MSSFNGSIDGNSNVPVKEKEILDRIIAATRAEVDEVKYVLSECDGDVNEAVNRLMDNPFTSVKTKKGKRGSKKLELNLHGQHSRERRDSANRVVEVPKRGHSNGVVRGGQRTTSRSERGLGAPGRVQASSAASSTNTSSVLEGGSKSPAVSMKWDASGGSNFADVLRRDAKLVQHAPVVQRKEVLDELPEKESSSMNEGAKAVHSSVSGSGVGMTNFTDKLSANSTSDNSSTTLAKISNIHSAKDPTPVAGIPPSTWVSSSSADMPTESLAGLLAGNASSAVEDEAKPVMQIPPGMSTGNAAGVLSLQFGQFSITNNAMGDFGSGFGSAYGEESTKIEAAGSPSVKQDPEKVDIDVKKPNSGFSSASDSLSSYPSHQPFSYTHPITGGNVSLTTPPVSSVPDPPPSASSVPPVSEGFYGGGTMYSMSQQDQTYQYSGDQGSGEDQYPVSTGSSSSIQKFPTVRQDISTGREGSQLTPGSSTPAAAAPVQPVVPQMHAFPHGMPPSIAAQYGYIHHAQYPYVHNTNLYMYPNYPHPAYTGGAGYPPQAGQASNFPPSVGNTTYPGQLQSAAGPVKYSYPYAQQNSQNPVSSATPQTGFGSYSTQGAFGGEDSVSSGALTKDGKDVKYTPSSSQSAQAIVRDNPYMYLAGQGYQQQGYGGAAQSQFNNSSYAQYMPNVQYALGGQLHPQNLANQAGSGSNVGQAANLYTLQ